MAIVVYGFLGFGRGSKSIYDGTDTLLRLGHYTRYTLRIMYYEDTKHFQPILNLVAASGSRGYCTMCNKSYSEENNHRFIYKCKMCMQRCVCDNNAVNVLCKECGR